MAANPLGATAEMVEGAAVKGYKEGGGGVSGVLNAAKELNPMNLGNPLKQGVESAVKAYQAGSQGNYKEAGRQGVYVAADAAAVVGAFEGGVEPVEPMGQGKGIQPTSAVEPTEPVGPEGEPSGKPAEWPPWNEEHGPSPELVEEPPSEPDWWKEWKEEPQPSPEPEIETPGQWKEEPQPSPEPEIETPSESDQWPPWEEEPAPSTKRRVDPLTDPETAPDTERDPGPPSFEEPVEPTRESEGEPSVEWEP
jgi:hypothetical protein